MNWMNQNNNRAAVAALARRAVKTGGLSSTLSAVAIGLAAALMAALLLGTNAAYVSMKRQMARTQHGIYLDLTGKQADWLAGQEEFSAASTYRLGTGVELEGMLVTPAYFAAPTQELETYRLSAGHAPEAVDEAVVDVSLLELLGLPQTLGQQVTIPFLNGAPETFTVVGLTDQSQGGSQPVQQSRVLLSRAYAETGPQLAEKRWNLLVRLADIDGMNSAEAASLLYETGSRCGVPHSGVDPNDTYLNLLTPRAGERAALVGLCAAVAFVAVVVIYSIFYLAVAGRVRMYGQLRTIGMTPKQLRRMVGRQGTLLWLLAAPAGFAAAAGGVALFGPEEGFDAKGTALAALLSLGLTWLAVRLALAKPARLAAEVPPIEAARYQPWQPASEKTGSKKGPRPMTARALAKMNVARSRKKNLLTLLSLVLGGSLFVAAAVLMASWDLEGYARQGSFEEAEYVVWYDHNTENSLPHGENELQVMGAMGEPVQTALAALPGVEKVTASNKVLCGISWEGVGDSEYVSIAAPEELPMLERHLESGSAASEQQEGVFVTASGQWEELYGQVPRVGDPITLYYYDGQEQSVTLPVLGVAGNSIRDDLPLSGMLMVSPAVGQRLFGKMDTAHSLAVTMEGHSHTLEQDRQMAAFLADWPQLSLGTLTEELEEAAQSLAMVKTSLLAASGFVILFSLINLLNTLLSGLLARKRELALLAALGMTRRQVRAMLGWEAMFMAAANAAGSLALGTCLGWGLVQLMRLLQADYMQFAAAPGACLAYLAISLAAPLLITAACLNSFSRESLTERLRTPE